MQRDKKKFRILASAYQNIKETCGTLPPESGGILVGYLDDFIVREFIFDSKGRTSFGAYDPDVDFLNEELKKAALKGYSLIGAFHTHPRGCSSLSGDYGDSVGDLGYIKAFLDVNSHLEKFLSPIGYSAHDGDSFTFFPYVAERGKIEDYQMADLEIVPDSQIHKYEKETLGFIPVELPFDKTAGSIDQDILQNSKVVIVGVGGANYICDYLTRSGVKEIHAVDFDTVSESNLVTQGYFIEDLGKSKVAALGERLQRINPDLDYQGYNKDFLKMSNREVRRLMKGTDLLLMMTDDFHAQAFGNRISLSLQVPTIFAIMYEKGRCSELTINIPGVTPACHRCATEERYQAYEAGYVNDVTSTGSTMAHTQSLNVPITLLSLAVLHRNSRNLELGGWFGKTWERNLIQIRTHPEFGMESDGFFRDTFGDQPRVFALDSVWQKSDASIIFRSRSDVSGLWWNR